MPKGDKRVKSSMQAEFCKQCKQRSYILARNEVGFLLMFA